MGAGEAAPSLWSRIGRVLGVYYAANLEYRAEIFLWALTMILPFILMGVWTQAGQGGDLPLTPAEFARYFFAVFLVRQLTVTWVIWLFEDAIVEGTLSFRLLQPLDPVWMFVANHVSERLARLPILVVATGVFFALYPEAMWMPDLTALLWFAFLVNAAFALRFLISYTFAMLAFWTERASAIERVWYLGYAFLSGLIAPLDVFPAAVRDVALYTPFPYLIYLPAQALLGRDAPLGRGLVVMAVWGVATFALNRLLWRRGLKRFSGMGA